MSMRRYWLASTEARENVDLRLYENIIIEAVHSIKPNASVIVNEDFYTVDPTPSQGEAVKIGRTICKSDLSKHCISIAKLFNSRKVGGCNNGAKGKKSMGRNR